MAKFDEYLEALKDPLAKLAKETLEMYKVAAKEDIQAFIEETKKDLKRWTDLLGTKKITSNEYFSLLKGAESLGVLHALKQAGLLQVQIDVLISGVIAVLVNTAITIFL